jgi:uncharacterized membrane protein YphA (DoxX/SURF4 family)
MNKYLNILARALVAAIFLFSGLGKLIGFNETVAMAASEGLPLPTVSIAAAAHIGDPSQSRMQTVEVMKNLAIIGGLLRFYLGASSELRDGVARSSS